jgi:hypothetical protein
MREYFKRGLLVAALLAVALCTTAAVLWSPTSGDVNFSWLSPGGITGLPRISVDTGTKTVTASSNTATLNKMAGVITSEALSTAAGATYTLTLTNSSVALADQVLASVNKGTSTNTLGIPVLATASPLAGSVVFTVYNVGASALNGTIQIRFLVVKN